MPDSVWSLSDLPNVPAVYALYGGHGAARHVAYIGIAGKLRQRVEQHLVRRDSSVTTGASTVALNPDLVTGLEWWTDPGFADREVLEAAELVAFGVFQPVLRSRGGKSEQAKILSADAAFVERMRSLFQGSPDGHLTPVTLADAIARIEKLEQQLAELTGQGDS